MIEKSTLSSTRTIKKIEVASKKATRAKKVVSPERIEFSNSGRL